MRYLLRENPQRFIQQGANQKKFPDKIFTYIDVSSVDNKLFKIVNSSLLYGRDAPSRARKIVKEHDVVFATVRPTLKRVAYITKDLDDRICSTGFCVLRSKKELESKFLYYWLLTDFVFQEVKKTQRGASYPAIRDSDLKGFQISIPPIKEQKIIAGVLSLVQNAIAQQEKAIALTTELKKALMQKLFTEGTRKKPQKQTEIGLIPESWDIVAWGKIAKIGNGATPKKSNVDYWENGNIPWLTSTKIHDSIIVEPDRYVTPQAVKECHLPLVKANSLLVAITGQGKTLGNSALVTFDTRINQHLAYAQFNTTDIFPPFVLAFMQGRYEHLRGIAKAGGSTKGALTCGFLKTYPIPVPKDKQEQETSCKSLIKKR